MGIFDAITNAFALHGASQNAKWGQAALVNTLNTMNGAVNTGLGMGQSAFNPALMAALGGQDHARNLLENPNGGLGSQQQSIYDYLSGINRGDFTQSGLQGRNGANLDYVANNQANQTLRGQDGLNTASDMYTSLLGGGGPNGDLTSAGRGAIENNGLSAYDSRLQSMGDYVLTRGGYDDKLNSLYDNGRATMANSGLTATGQAAQQAGLEGVLNGGRTGPTQALQQIGTNFAGQQALLPAAMAAGFAKDQAGQQARKAAEAFQAQALARGGGAGSTVANGAANAGMADFANNIAESQANAYQNAITQQQGLNLQQQGQGAQMALGAGNLEANRFGTYGNLLTGQQGVQNQANQIGGNQVSSAAQNANASAGTYGNLGVAGGQNGNQRLGIGTNALNNATGNLLGGGAGLNNAANTANNAYNSTVGNQLGSGALGNTQGNSFYSQLGNLLGLGSDANKNALGLNSTDLQALINLSGQGLGYASDGLSGQSGLFTGYASTTNNNKAQAWNNLSQSVAPKNN